MDHERINGTPKPIAARNRFGAIDTLRGFALLGILVPNIVVFAWPMMAMTDYTMMGDTPANKLGYTITTTAFTGKFMFLFALLFGSGVVMYARKFDTADEDGKYHSKLSKGASLWYIRCGLLLGFGLLHAYGLWFGDILTYYAVAGLTLLWWVRRLDPKLQFFGGLALYYLGSILILGLAAVSYWALSEGHLQMSDLVGNPFMEIVGYRGTFFDAFQTRFFTTISLHLFVIPSLMPMLWGMMMMGMGLTRMGILTGERSIRFYLVAGVICLLIGIPLTAGGFMTIYPAYDLATGFMWQSFAQPIGVPLAFGYGALVIAFAKWSPAKILSVPLAAVGRMALTNYFLQTILCTTFFYGYGFGQFASIEFHQLWWVVVGVWGINIVFSMVWLRFFSMGPFEWVWRVLTYRQLVPIVRGSVRSEA